ncbi:hypothetical protein [Prescottella equi]|uniref:hypothetical protein n=1 Tax=Rhodococcus hoagii TaxID=43767 RepID=UPI0039BE2937
MSGAEAARRHGVSDMSVSKWKQQFLDAGRQRLEEQPSGPGCAAAAVNGLAPGRGRRGRVGSVGAMCHRRLLRRVPSPHRVGRCALSSVQSIPPIIQ